MLSHGVFVVLIIYTIICVFFINLTINSFVPKAPFSLTPENIRKP